MQAFKYVSDLAGEGVNCLDIQSLSETYSNAFYKHFTLCSYGESATPLVAKVVPNKKDPRIFEDSKFYFSFTQKKQFNKLISFLKEDSGLSQKKALDKSDLENISNQKLTPKLRSKLLLNNLQDLHQPLEKKLREKIKNHFKALKTYDINVSPDPIKGGFSLKGKILNEKEWQQFIHTLSEIDSKALFLDIDGQWNED